MNTYPQSISTKGLAFSLATFLAVIYLACVALVVIVPNVGLHTPWLQFFPGFAWTLPGIAAGLAESIVYGLFAGALFAPIYNYFNG